MNDWRPLLRSGLLVHVPSSDRKPPAPRSAFRRFDQKLATEIFQPFKRLHSPSDFPGTGIALAICKAIADRYGWPLAARSRPGEGSTFEIILPAQCNPGSGESAS